MSGRRRGLADNRLAQFAGNSPATIVIGGRRNQGLSRLRWSALGLAELVRDFAGAFDGSTFPAQHASFAGGEAHGEVPFYALPQAQRGEFNARVGAILGLAREWATRTDASDSNAAFPMPAAGFISSNRSDEIKPSTTR